MQGEMEPTRDTIIARVSAACASQMTPAQVLWLFEDAGITDLEELKACCRSDRAFIFTESIQGMERAVALICINSIKIENRMFFLERPASVLIAHAKAQRIATMLGLYLHCNSNILMHWSLPM